MPQQQRKQGGERREPTQQEMQDAQYEDALRKSASFQTSGNRRAQQQGKDDSLIDTTQIRRRLKISLRSLQKQTKKLEDGTTRTYYVPNEDDALINEKGFNKIWSLIEGVINENITGAYWNHGDEYSIGRDVMGSLILQIVKKWREWDIQDWEDADQIVSIVSTNLKAVASKARNARAMKYNEQQREIREVKKTGDENERSNNPFNIFS